ncbi:transglutaminaseTgpA domain-containing protein [Cryobacterium psychrophilum]|uniref:Transglutaminase domain-containing protein n=1 Tax=Cryobacterium psychrophilum TaxID=41988 RepID=A0A4Y8KMU4_9MICO|nr:transglutaminase domain-containing protein [Cryobacterium psychrophilum]TDW29147.1 transglutaminase superfamily protein [Cryobacterium psychrophilum]TFD77810.1 transglutaminase domain-containing protein [Cryobacterium psychrophilum]
MSVPERAAAGTGESPRRTARAWVRPRRRLVAGHTLALLLATIAASVTLWPVYQSRHFVVAVLGAFVVGALIAVGGAFFRWQAWIVMLATLAGFLLVGVPLAVPGRAVAGIWPSAVGLVELLAASALSWKQLVTIVLPVGSYQTLLVPVLILVLVSTVAGLSTALRSRVPERAVLAPALFFLAGIVLGPTAPFSPVLSSLGFFAVVLGWLLWMRRNRRASNRGFSGQGRQTRHEHRSGARTMMSAAALIMVAVSVGTVAAIAAPATTERDVLRARVQQPFNPQDYASPLSEFRSYLQPALADETLFEVTGLPRDGRLRLATLDGYDGIVYSAGNAVTRSAAGSFTRLPYRLDQSQVAGEPTVLSVTVDGYTGRWVPGIGQLEQIEFGGATALTRSDAFFYNDIGASAAVLTGLIRGDSYRSESVTPPRVSDLSALRPGSAVQPPVGVVPDGLVLALDGYISADAAPGAQLQQALDGLASDGYVSHGLGADEPLSRSGHGADRITQLFTDVPMLGDEEQYAVAAALMARQIGFPARVVVGFAPQTDAGGSDAVRVTGSDASAWLEVQSSTDNWVTIDPTPTVRDIPANQPDEPTVVSRPQSVLPPPVVDTPQQRDPAPAERAVEEPVVPLSPLLAFLLAAAVATGWTVLGLLVVLSPVLFVVAAKARRRRLRRTGPTPLARISGAWREFADAATDRAVPLPANATRLELAAAVDAIAAPLDGAHTREDAHVLARAVDRAVFSPVTPSAADADAVWDRVDDLRRGFGAGRTRRERLRAVISLRSFSRYAGGKAQREGAGS